MAGARAARATRARRGVAAAAFATFAASVTHSTAQGEAAPLLGIVLAFALSAPVCVALAGRALSWLRLSVAVIVSQAGFHTLLGVGVGAATSTPLTPVGVHALHAAALAPSGAMPGHALFAHADPWMWTAHALAAAVTIVVFGKGEETLRAVLRFVADRLLVWRAVALPAPQRAPRIPRLGRLLADPGFVLLSVVQRRGPPLPA